MAYVRTVMRGSLGTTEVWSTSQNWGVFGAAPDTPNQALVDAILLQLRTATTAANVGTSLLQLLATNGTIDGWRVELRAENETILSVAEGLLNTPLVGTLAPSKTPQDAIVVSLRTNTPGPRGRGRIYWPAVGATLSSGFQLTGPTTVNTVSGAKVWLKAIGDAINAGFLAAGMAQTVVLAVRSITDHVCRDVVSLQVGTVLDTQRRRRDALPESYSAVSYP